MKKITLTKKDLEAEEDISPKRRRDSEISFGDTSSGYSSLSDQFAGNHFLIVGIIRMFIDFQRLFGTLQTGLIFEC